MLNHNKRLIKSKSKILLLALCIFGLVFSYSCNCRNNSTAPNDGPPPPSGTNIQGGTASGDYLMIVDSAGTGYKQEATVSFANATATLKSVTDVDSGMAIEEGDFVYDGNTKTLKLKADTTDATKIDATTGAKITWKGNDTKKVKATFTLTPSATNVDLDATEKEVEFQIAKVETWTMNSLATLMKSMDNGVAASSGLNFEFKDATPQNNGLKMTPQNNRNHADGSKVSKSDFGDKFLKIVKNKFYNKGLFEDAKLVKNMSDITATDNTISFEVDFTPSQFYEKPQTFTGFYITVDLTWTEQGAARKGAWVD